MFPSALRSTRLTASLGLWLGVSFAICFLTGLLSHLIQHPPGWFSWPPRPVQLYRVTQGIHVATGLACIPLLTAKIWSVLPKLFTWPPVRGVAHAVDRATAGLLSAVALFQLVTGVLNIAYWYRPMPFAFIAAHYWTAWLAVGALALHAAVKLPLLRSGPSVVDDPPDDMVVRRSRRRFLGLVGATAGLVTLATVGQTVRPLRNVSVLAPRVPDVGPQGVPVNRTAASARVSKVDENYRLALDGPAGRTMLSLADLRALPQSTVDLPISCVEGWSAGGRWTGVAFAELVRRAGGEVGRARVRVESLERAGAYRSSVLEPNYAANPKTLLALRLAGDELDLDHGYPCRLIAPNRPGVLQTKWIGVIVVEPV
jgi:DMSO/TMAO reductase YedYZ molybdopterin-dependent catalytic subunit